MKNIALCFDRARHHAGPGGPTNAVALAGLLRCDGGQLVWSPGDAPPSGRRWFFTPSAECDSARATVVEAYQFLVAEWEPGDRLFLFGTGLGASCARALARLIGVVGVLNADLPGWTADDFRAYVLSTYVLPRTHRDDTDWENIGRLAADLSGRGDVGVGVEFLGLWDSAPVPGLPGRHVTESLPNVVAARHAVAIDGGHGHLGAHVLDNSDGTAHDVWFRGAHCDVAGGRNACLPLSAIALDWVLDGAIRAGAVVRQCPERTAPSAVDALAGCAHTVSFRKLPADAVVHASVETYLHAHPSYWRRLPAHVMWADLDWAARSERLMPVSGPASQAPPIAAEIPALVAAS